MMPQVKFSSVRPICYATAISVMQGHFGLRFDSSCGGRWAGGGVGVGIGGGLQWRVRLELVWLESGMEC